MKSTDTLAVLLTGLTTQGVLGGRDPARPPEHFNWNLINDHYPYKNYHDDNRPGHTKWDQGDPEVAYCLHVKPGFRVPEPYIGPYPTLSPYLPPDCTNMLHTDIAKEEGVNVKACGEFGSDVYSRDKFGYEYADHNPPLFTNYTTNVTGADPYTADETETFRGYKAYIALDDGWKDIEHCRASCETCFDAMAEFGAEQAICRRAVGRTMGIGKKPKCGMGLVRGKLPLEDCTPSGGNKDVQANCELEWDMPRYKELGYSSSDEAMKDVQVYYVQDLDSVGKEVGGDWGMEEVKRAVLDGDRIEDMKDWLKKNKPKNL